MLEWILNTLNYNKDKIITNNLALLNSKLELLKKRRAVKIIEKAYLCYKKKLEIKKARKDRRQLYRVLNRTNPEFLTLLKKN